MTLELSTAAFGCTAGTWAAPKVFHLQPSSARAVVSQVDRKWRSTVVGKLNELVALPVGWDGYVAPPVSFATAEFALRMLESICSADCACPQIVPGSGGDLQIEWHIPSGSIELHVRNPNDVHAWRTGFGSADYELELTNDFTVVVGWLRSVSWGNRASSTTAA